MGEQIADNSSGWTSSDISPSSTSAFTNDGGGGGSAFDTVTNFASGGSGGGTDSFTEVTSESWLGRLGQSIVGVLIGILFFFGSFAFIFWNEGRAVKQERSLSEGQGVVRSVSADKADASNNGKLVYVTGQATTDETLTDPDLGVAAKGLLLMRKVEMFQWTENKNSETRKKLGGGTETRTTYTYKTGWVDHLVDSNGFKQPGGHANPTSMPPSKPIIAQKATLGGFRLPEDLVKRISNSEPVPPNLDTLPARLRSRFHVDGSSYFQGDNPGSPRVGDRRVTYTIVKPTTVSIIAQQSGDTFAPYQTKAGNAIEELAVGTKSAENMFATAQQNNNFVTWILRLVGFILMFAGLNGIFKPFETMADVIPFLGDLLGAGIGLFCLAVTLPLTLLTIAIAWIAVRPLLGILLIGGSVAAFLAFKNMTGQRKAMAGRVSIPMHPR